jgi:hypothetical protein
MLTACGGGKRTDDSAAAPSPTLVAGTPTPTSTEAIAPNRQDCSAIVNTPFQSPEEAAWYRANCARFDGPPVADSGSSQPPIGDRLIIASQSIDTPVHRTSVPESAVMPDPIGYFNAVWYDFSKFEGFGGYANAGNLVLSGHVDCARCINGGSGRAVFYNIRNLKAGDTAQYLMANGTTITYVVTNSVALNVNSNWDEIVSSSHADMTLITCTGTFSGGEYNQRHVVTLKIQA